MNSEQESLLPDFYVNLGDDVDDAHEIYGRDDGGEGNVNMVTAILEDLETTADTTDNDDSSIVRNQQSKNLESKNLAEVLHAMYHPLHQKKLLNVHIQTKQTQSYGVPKREQAVMM